jgi:4-amino-4-deoxy-L-arabinose transferase-like glycosyltransferase
MPRNRILADLVLVAGFCAFLFFFGLGSFGLVGADEPRYAQIAREMLARHDWVTPVLYGKPWLEKPILYYWEAMLAYSAFGVADWAARVPSAVSATAVVFAIYFFVRRFRPGVQLDAGLIAASCAAMIGFGRGASTDMPMTAPFAMAMLAWFAWRQTARRRWLAGFYVCTALAMLAKGPVAPVLAAIIIVLFAVARREPALIWRTLWAPGIALFCAVGLPWYVAVQVRTPEFFRVFFLEHNLARFTTNMFRHKQPFWYYVPVIMVGMLPWTVLAIASMFQGFKHRGHRGGATEDTEGNQKSEIENQKFSDGLSLFLMLWIAVPFLFFSAAQSKLPGYILPVVPAFALLIADYLWGGKGENRRAGFWLLAAHSAMAALVLSAALLAQYGMLRVAPSRQAATIAGAIAAIVFIAMLATLRAQGLRVLRFVTLVPVILGLGFVLRVSGPALDARLSARPVARELALLETRKSEVAAFNVNRETEYGLAFYRDQSVQRYERAEIPVGDHLLVARQGSQPEFAVLIPGRRASRVGGYAPQKLEFYWISSGSQHMH